MRRARLGHALRRFKIGCERSGPLAFLLKGLLQLLRCGFRCLSALCRFVIRLARRCYLFELTARRRELARQPNRSLAFLLQGLLQLLRCGFRCLSALCRFVIRLARRCYLFELTARRRELARQPNRSLAFLLQGLLQLLRCGFRCLSALCRFVLRLARQRDLFDSPRAAASSLASAAARWRSC